MNFLFMLFDRLWDIAGDIILLNCYAGIFKRKYIKKDVGNYYFYQFIDFLQIIIKVLVIVLCIHLAKYPTIDAFHI